MNIEAVYNDQIAQLHPPSDWESNILVETTEENEPLIKAARNAADTVKKLHTKLQNERSRVNRWIQAIMKNDFGRGFKGHPDENTGGYDVNYYHHGELTADDERVGFGLTSVYELDTHDLGTPYRVSRVELGWHQEEQILVCGLFFCDGYNVQSRSKSSIREIDPNSKIQTGLWFSRLGGPRLGDPRGAPTPKSSDQRMFLGSFEPFPKEKEGDIDAYMGKGVMIESSTVLPANIVKRAIWRVPEHLLRADLAEIHN